MNERNVQALYELIEGEGEAGHAEIRRRPSMTHQEVSRFMAERMAACGVLVPSVLTDDEMGKVLRIGKQCVDQDDPLIQEDNAREALERIAKGEAP